MRNDTKVLLICGGAIMAFTAGPADLLVRALAAAGVYAGSEMLGTREIRVTSVELAKALEQMSEGQRKQMLREAQQRFKEDLTTLKWASTAMAFGTFVSPPLGIITFVVAAVVRKANATKEINKRRVMIYQQQLEQQQRRATVVEANQPPAEAATATPERQVVDGILVG